MRHLFNPLRTGWFSLGLFVNKVLRRLIPFFLMGLFVSSLFLAAESKLFLVGACLQAAFYLGAALSPWLSRFLVVPSLRRITTAAFYFCVGNWGTALGVGDFLLNRQVVKWDPRKTG